MKYTKTAFFCCILFILCLLYKKKGIYGLLLVFFLTGIKRYYTQIM